MAAGGGNVEWTKELKPRGHMKMMKVKGSSATQV